MCVNFPKISDDFETVSQRKELARRFSRQHSSEDVQSDVISSMTSRRYRRRSTVAEINLQERTHDAKVRRRMSKFVEEPIELIKKEREKEGHVCIVILP